MKGQLKPYINSDQAEASLNEIGFELSSWVRTKNTDSKLTESRRRRDLLLAKNALVDLHYHLAPTLTIDINTGSEPVDGSTFRKDSYDFKYEELRTLEPDTIIPFERIEDMQFDDRPGSTFYIGNYVVMLSLPVLAEAMSHGGGLLLSPAAQPASARQ